MDSILLKKIYHGDTGSVAAAKVYQNDQQLKQAINTIKEYLEVYGDLIQFEGEVESAGTMVQISLVQGPGSGTTAVMSQNAVTNFVYDNVNDMCVVGEEISTPIDMPPTAEYTDAWVSRASSNAQGHSLTVLYDDVENLKNTISTINTAISDILSEISTIKDRITVLEDIVLNEEP